MDKKWEVIEKFDVHQDGKPSHPFSDLTFQQIQHALYNYNLKYGTKYTDLKIELNWRTYGYGAINYWYELLGSYSD